jgi:hypothetical protein
MSEMPNTVGEVAAFWQRLLLERHGPIQPMRRTFWQRLRDLIRIMS